jgi:hypothetical protein
VTPSGDNYVNEDRTLEGRHVPRVAEFLHFFAQSDVAPNLPQDL